MQTFLCVRVRVIEFIKNYNNNAALATAGAPAAAANANATTESAAAGVKAENLVSPLKGEAVDLSEVKDDVFPQGPWAKGLLLSLLKAYSTHQLPARS